MVRNIGLLVIFSVLCVHMENSFAAEKEVLVRDRLVFLLCDQMAEYMSSGKYPEEVKTMPEKYKKIKPGGGGDKGRTMNGYHLSDIKGNKTKPQKGRSSKGKGNIGNEKTSNRLKRNYHMTILDLNDDQWW